MLVLTASCSGGGGSIVDAGGGGGGGGATTVAGLRFVTQPSNLTAGQALVVSVELISAAGTRVTSANTLVTLSLSGGTLTGNTSVNAVSGLATFSGLTITSAGANFVLSAAAGIYSTTSSPFTVSAAAASSAQSSMSLPSGAITANADAAITFTFRDAYGNAKAQATVTVSASLAGVTLTPSSGTTDASGRFATTLRSTVAGSTSITAVVDGTSIVFSPAIVIAADLCAATTLSLPFATSGTVSSSACVQNGELRSYYRFTSSGTLAGVRLALTPSGFAPRFALMLDPNPGSNFINFFSSISGTSLTRLWIVPAGTYQVRVASQNGSPGTFTLTGAAENPNLTTTTAGGVSASSGGTCPVYAALIASMSVSGQSIQTTDCRDGTFAYDSFLIYATTSCTVTMTSSAVDPWLEVFDAATGSFIGSDDDSGGGTSARLTMSQCQSTAGNVLEFRPQAFSSATYGAYTLTVTITGSAAVLDAAPSGLGSAGADAVRTIGAAREASQPTRPRVKR
jgi:hypothetical protein